MSRLRGLDRKPLPMHISSFTGTIADASTGAPIRVGGTIAFHQKTTALPGPDGEGRGPLVWKCAELPEDDLAADESDLRKAFDREFSEKNREDIKRAPESPDTAAHLRAKHAREWRIAVFNRGRRPLHVALLGKTLEQIASIVRLADPPPAIGGVETPPPEVSPAPVAVGSDPLRAILRPVE
jgi:hypothetical protein